MTKDEEKVVELLKTVTEHFQREDRSARDRLIRQWKELRYLWDGISRVWWSEVAHDWRVYEPTQNGDDSNQSYYDKPFNIFKPYLETIIAALSVTVPPITCYPDDATNGLDLSTAKAGDKIAQLVYRHNNAELLWVKALYILCTQGTVAAYNYTDADEKYGVVKKDNYETELENHKVSTCPICNNQIDDEKIQDIYDPSFENYLEICPYCQNQVVPNVQQQPLEVQKFVGQTSDPKSRQCIEVFGGLNVKIPIWASSQKQCPYLIYSYEDDWANIAEEYQDLSEALRSSSKGKNGGAYNEYEEWGRLSTQYRGEFPINNRTVRKVWLRPAAFNILPEDDCALLKKKFPDGCRVVFVNDLFAEVVDESLDDHWTIIFNPTSDFLIFDPLGLLLTSVQSLTNDIISLTEQTMEHGIGQTFVDDGVIDLDAYSQTEVLPGGIYPAKAKSGKSLQDGFYQVKTATLSQEVMPFAEKIQELGQFMSGALPSIFGGALAESNTASEYAMSRNMALQRLQNTWKMLKAWWKEVFGKVIPAYIKELKEDENEVQKDPFGGFINIYIRLSELEGKIGKVELEAHENLPITWQQQKDTIMQLLQTNNPEILAALAAPENLPVLRKAIGLTDFFVPGDDDREKQYSEIHELINQDPMTIPPSIDPAMAQQAPGLVQANPQMMQMMQPQEVSSVPVDQLVDNHEIHLEICKAWAVSEYGRLCKVENPEGYKNVLLHAQQHLQLLQPPPMAGMPQQGAGPAQPKESTSAPIQQESDINVQQ